MVSLSFAVTFPVVIEQSFNCMSDCSDTAKININSVKPQEKRLRTVLFTTY